MTSTSTPPAIVPPPQRSAILTSVLEWYHHQRRDLPWRHTRDPYAILVAEVMLQQTQVDRVLPKYLEFLNRFPTVEALAGAPTADVIRLWSGLGYNTRAVRLQQAARLVATEYNGRFPRDLDALLSLPGLGPYSARAIACFAFEERMPVVDTNVRRVLGRLYRSTVDAKASDREFLELAAAAMPDERSYEWNQALMDLGATICTSRRPLCLLCPAQACCDAIRTGNPVQQEQVPGQRAAGEAPFVGSTRYYRGRILAALRAVGVDQAVDIMTLGGTVKPGFGLEDQEWLDRLLAGLERDGLVTRISGEAPSVRLP